MSLTMGIQTIPYKVTGNKANIQVLYTYSHTYFYRDDTKREGLVNKRTALDVSD